MKQYPYIGEAVTGNKYLMSTNEVGVKLGGGVHTSLNGRMFTNITQEYLSNTWGVVESKEHAEFIIELAELHGFAIYKDSYPIRRDIFSFNKHGTLFFHEDNGLKLSSELKQITIPLPPKTELPEAGHNLVFAAPECKEWPCVNDRVIWGDLTHKGVIKSLSDGFAWIKRDSGEYETVYISSLQKPKTPEEALRDELISYISTYLAVIPGLLDKPDEAMYASHQAACTLLTKYNITPKEV